MGKRWPKSTNENGSSTNKQSYRNNSLFHFPSAQTARHRPRALIILKFPWRLEKTSEKTSNTRKILSFTVTKTQVDKAQTRFGSLLLASRLTRKNLLLVLGFRLIELSQIIDILKIREKSSKILCEKDFF